MRLLPLCVVLLIPGLLYSQDRVPMFGNDSDQQAKRLDEHDARLDRIEAALLQLAEGQRQTSKMLSDCMKQNEGLRNIQKQQQSHMSDLSTVQEGYQSRRVQQQSQQPWKIIGYNSAGPIRSRVESVSYSAPIVQPVYSAPVQIYSQPAIQYQAAPVFQSSGGYGGQQVQPPRPQPVRVQRAST